MAMVPRSQPLQANDKPLRSRARKPRDPCPATASIRPMPDRVEPCLALIKPQPPIGAHWTFTSVPNLVFTLANGMTISSW
jgi:bifunctional non-homologous end joining protein LigD